MAPSALGQVYDLEDPQVRRTAQALVADRLRIEILSGIVAPGMRLQQANVAKRMRTSTTPVREAFRELAGEGLIDLDPHRGVIVHEPSKSELLEVYEMRSVLEPMCMTKTVERISDRELGDAEALCRQMEREKVPGAWVMLNDRFHSVLASASRSPLLIASVNNLRNRSAIYIAASFRLQPDRMTAANNEHQAMVDACRRRDVQAALRQVRLHIEATVELGSLYLEQHAPVRN